jgi:hypothetical protein
MGLLPGSGILVADSAGEFADHVVSLLSDDDLWAKLSASGRTRIDELMGIEALHERLDELDLHLSKIGEERGLTDLRI